MHLREPSMVKSIPSGFVILYYHFFWSFELHLSIPPVLKLSFIFDHLPSAYLFSAQL